MTNHHLPKTVPHIRNLGELTTSSQEYNLTIITDGTNTVAEITAKGPQFHGDTSVSVGVAKRHKSDPHDTKVGEVLAVQRAFAIAAARYGDMLAELLAARRDIETVTGLTAKMDKAEKKARKDIKRAGQRANFYAEHGFDHRSGAGHRQAYIKNKENSR